MARALSRSAPLTRLIEGAAEEARRVLRAASVSVSRVVPGTQTIQTVINVGELGPDEERWPQNETYCTEDFRTLSGLLGDLRTWLHDANDPNCPAEERALLEQFNKGSAIEAPLVVDGLVWGHIYATRSVGEAGYGDLDAAYVEALLAILSGAVSRALREESLERLAYRDALTGLANRRALDERADRLFRLPVGGVRRLTALAVDINGLKQVNDTMGHLAGDQLISSVALDLQRAFSVLPDALAARVGGDEFMVLVADVDQAEVVAVADRLCRLTWAEGMGATISAGVATVTLTHGDAQTPAGLFTAADKAQYVAKKGRLTRTVVADDLETARDQLAG